MPIERRSAEGEPQPAVPAMPAARAVYRLAAGAALATAFAYGVGLPLPFLAVVLAVLLLGAPKALPGRAAALVLVFLALSGLWGLLLGSLLQHMPVLGLLVMMLAIGVSARLSANPGTALLGTFFLLGSSIVAVLARQSSAVGVGIVQAIMVGALAAIVITHVVHLLFPDPPRFQHSPASTASPAPGAAVSRLSGLRASLVMLPPVLLALWDPARFMLLLMKGGTLAQQVEATRTRAMARELVESTFVGGLVALAIWLLLRPWPSLFTFALLVGFAALLIGRRLYGIVPSSRGPQHWQSVLVTAIILIGPAVEDSVSGDDIGRESLTRFVAFLALAGYVALTVHLLEGWGRRGRRAVEKAGVSAS